MHKLILLLSIILIVSCRDSNIDERKNQASSNENDRVWHLKDTITNTAPWPTDSVRHVAIDISHPLAHLEVRSDGPVYLFQGDKLIKKTTNGFLTYSLAGLKEGKLFLSLDRKLQNLSYGIYTFEKRKEEIIYSSLDLIERDRKMISNNIFLILSIFALVFMVILKINYDKRYFTILSVNKVFSTRLYEGDQSRARILDQDNFVFAGFYAFLMAGLIYFLGTEGNQFFLEIEAIGILRYFQILFFVAIGFIGKVILVSLTSNLFGNYKISAFYTKEMLNINLFFILILFFSSVLIYLVEGKLPAFWLTTATYSLFAFYVLRLLLLYFKILKLSNFSNLYLFSYFCTTEIFPFLIGLKYFYR